MAFVVTSRGTGTNGTGAAVATISVGAFTPSADSLLFLVGIAENDNASSTNPTAAVPTATGLTFTAQSEVEGASAIAIPGGGFEKIAGFYTAPVGGSPSSITVTWDGTTDTAAWYSAACFDVTGHNVATPVVQVAAPQSANPSGGSSPAETVTLASTPAVGNLVVVMFAAAVNTAAAIAAPTIGGQAMTSVVTNSPNDYEQVGVWSRVITGTESDNVITSTSVGGTQTWATFGFAIEIADAPSGLTMTGSAGALVLAGTSGVFSSFGAVGGPSPVPQPRRRYRRLTS